MPRRKGCAMVDKMRLEVILSAVDKVSGTLKQITTGSKATADAIGQAHKALSALEGQQRAVDRFKRQAEQLRATREQLRAARQGHAELAGEIHESAQAQKNHAAQLKAAESAVKKLTASYDKQAESLRRAKAEMEKRGVSDPAKAQARLAVEVDRATQAIERQKGAFEQQRQVEQRLHALREKHSSDMARLGMRGATAAGAMYAGRRMAQAGLQPVGAFMQHENAMLGILRQVEGARGADGQPTEVYRKAEAQIRELSGRLPQTTTQIADMMTAAARMEVPTDKLSMFVELASEMGTAFDTAPDEVAENMGKIAKNLKMPITEIRGMADTINYLDDNAISKGADIIGALNRVSGITGTVGITGQNMAALVSTLLTSGETEETTGTGIKALFTNLAAATKGSKRFRAGVAEIGMTPEQLEKGMAKDAVGMLLQVADAINRIPEQSRLGVMAELAGKEHVGRLAKLVTNTEELRRQIALANGEDAKGSMAREAAVRNQALEARLQMAKNRVFNAMAEAGKHLKGAIVELLDVVNPLLERFTSWAQENPAIVGGVLKAVVVLGVLTTVLGGLGVALVAVLGPLAIARFVMARWALSLAAAKVGAAGAAGGFAMLRGAVGGLWRMLTRFPLVSIALGIATALHSIVQAWDSDKPIGLILLEGFVAGVDAMFLGIPSAIAKLLTGLFDLLTGAGWEIGKALVGGVIAAIEGMLNSLTAGLYGTAKGAIGKAWDYVTGGGDAPGADKVRAVAAAGAIAVSPMAHAQHAGQVNLQRPEQPVAMAPRATAAPGGNTTNQITINPAPGMDEKAVGRAVAAELDRRERQKAARVRSQLSDID